MPDFGKNIGTPMTPWGVREFLRSTKNWATESYMCAASSVPAFTRDGNPNQKELPAGVVMAKITAGPDVGKVGPFQAAGTAEVQAITPSGTWAGATGSYQLTAGTSTTVGDTIAVPVATTAAQLAALIAAMPSYAAFVPSVTGGPIGTGAFTVTFGGGAVDADVPQLVFAIGSVTGGTTPGATVTTSTQGSPGSADGRATLANIVGLNLTSVPWQFRERDVEISALYKCDAVQGWCMELNAAGMFVPVSQTTAAAMQRGGAAGKLVDIGWH